MLKSAEDEKMTSLIEVHLFCNHQLCSSKRPGVRYSVNRQWRRKKLWLPPPRLSLSSTGSLLQFLPTILLITSIYYVSGTLATTDINVPDPKFSAAIANVTVPVGREAVLTCLVHDLGSYKVAWLRVDTQTILSIQNHVITKNHRIGITYTEKRIWQLRIKDVKETDRGWYMCQINTDPMKSQVGFLEVVVPPDILDDFTSQDMIVREGSNATLQCAAVGQPSPIITWRRERGKPLLSVGSREIFTAEGSTLAIQRVTRHHMGAYLCIASNGIPPTVSKRMLLIVNFPPTISVRHQGFSIGLGQKITLECITESYPNSVNYWLHNGRENEVLQGGTIEQVMMENVYKVIMRLTIRPTKPDDFGTYKCVAKNSLGEAEEIITVDHKKRVDLLAHYQPNTLHGGQTSNRSSHGKGSGENWKTNAANLLHPSAGSQVYTPINNCKIFLASTILVILMAS